MRRNEIIILILCLLVGFALRFYHLDKKSLWLDEIYTFDYSKYDLSEQLSYYKEKPTYIQAPLFFVLTHLFYPFTHPERDLRIFPFVFGTLSILMIYLLAKAFSPIIAFPCTLSLTFMAYHISLSQEGRSYSLLLFLGMAGLYFFMKHLITLKKRYLILAALLFAVLFHTGYSSIPFIALSQLLWFYRGREDGKKPRLSSFLTLNGFLFLLCLPWIYFLILNYKGETVIDLLQLDPPRSLWYLMYGVLHDWVPYAPLMIVSAILLILLPLFSKYRENAIILLAVFILPIAGLYAFCKLFDITHFVTSRYFINFLPVFLISLYLSLNAIEFRFDRLKRFVRLSHLFAVLFIASNLIILPLYYRSEKQDFRGLATYLKSQLRDGDKVFFGPVGSLAGLLHYLGVYPEERQYFFPYRTISEKENEVIIFVTDRNRKIMIFHSEHDWIKYLTDSNRVWIIVNKESAINIRREFPCVLKGYFDGSFLNFNRFPTDASLYLLLWDRKSPEEKGIDMPME